MKLIEIWLLFLRGAAEYRTPAWIQSPRRPLKEKIRKSKF